MNIDGTTQAQLTSHPEADAQPSFSPDGKRIAFWSSRSGNGDIYVMNAANGKGLVNVTKSAADEFEPVFSPDTNEIAFSSARDGNREIYVINLDTNIVRRLTNNPADDGAPDWK
jgi:TolB protein